MEIPDGARVRARRLVIAALVAALPALPPLAAPVIAQGATSAPAPTPTRQEAPASTRETPRGAVQQYLDAVRLGDYQRAAQSLDLRRVPPSLRQEQGPTLARQLGVLLGLARTTDAGSLSDVPEGETDDGLDPGLERVATLEAAGGPVDLLLHRTTEGEATVWKFAPSTVARVSALYGELGYGPLGDLLPRVLVGRRVLDIDLWQWVGIGVLALLAWLGAWLGALVLLPLLRWLAVRARVRVRVRVDDALLAAAVAPLRLGLGLAVFWLGVLALALPLHAQVVVALTVLALAIIAVGWLLLRAIDVATHAAAERMVARGRPAAVPIMPMAGKVAKAVVVGFVALALLQNVGFNITGILAGLGIGGLAVALAAQKTVENLFGGITLILDQPVRVGDFCRFGDRVGIIEQIGLRSTRVRTLDRTVVTVPNGAFAQLELENFAVRDRVWFHPRIGLRYETTPDQLRHVLVEIRKMLYAHPRVSPEPARIRFVGHGAYSLDLDIFAYVLTAEYGEFLAIQEDLLLRITDIVAASGTGFAFPSQTTYFARDTAPDAGRVRAAEEQVRAWRASGELYMPEFPPDQIAALRETLDYPPRGTPTGPAPPRA